MIDTLRSLTLAWMTSHTLGFIHFLVAIPFAVVLFRFFVRRPVA